MVPSLPGVTNALPRPQLIVNAYGIFAKIGGHTRKIEAEEVVSRYGTAVASAMLMAPGIWIEVADAEESARAEAAAAALPAKPALELLKLTPIIARVRPLDPEVWGRIPACPHGAEPDRAAWPAGAGHCSVATHQR